MRYLGISAIGVALFGMVLSGAVLAQTAGGTSSGAGSTSGTPTTGGGTLRPGTLPSTAPAQNLRSTTGVIQNQQTLDRPQDQPSTIQSDRPSSQPGDMPAGGTVTNSGQGGGGIGTGRPSRVQKNSNSERSVAVMGPGQLSYPAAMERRLPKTP
jgi:hypothetical protein